MKLTEFEALLKTVTPNVYHREAFKATPPYVEWHEYRKVARNADSRPYAGYWRVQVDYYTKTRLDLVGDAFEEAFADAGVPFKHTVSFDTELKLTRHLFDCEVLCG